MHRHAPPHQPLRRSLFPYSDDPVIPEHIARTLVRAYAAEEGVDVGAVANALASASIDSDKWP